MNERSPTDNLLRQKSSGVFVRLAVIPYYHISDLTMVNKPSP
jgi:hypothetical protein